MKRTYACSTALLLAVTTTAWAGGGLYPPATDFAGTSTVTRAQVIAEMQESHRLGLDAVGNGDLPVASTAQLRLIEAAGERASGRSSVPALRFAAPEHDAALAASDQRAGSVRVRAELAEAYRLGLMDSGESGPHITSTEQEMMITDAGQRAVDGLHISMHVTQ
jgi:hypothetical protein